MGTPPKVTTTGIVLELHEAPQALEGSTRSLKPRVYNYRGQASADLILCKVQVLPMEDLRLSPQCIVEVNGETRAIPLWSASAIEPRIILARGDLVVVSLKQETAHKAAPVLVARCEPFTMPTPRTTTSSPWPPPLGGAS